MTTYVEDDRLNINNVFFTYDAINLLHDMDEFENIKMYNKDVEIILVPFKINLNGKLPFNSIMLFNEYKEDLNFCSLSNTCACIENNTMLMSCIQCYLYSIFVTYKNTVNAEFDEFVKNVDFKGLYFFQEKLYVFIDLTKLSVNVSLINKDDLYWFALMDEIVNKKQICNITIHDDVVDFFSQNNEFIFFRNENKEVIEIPTVVYTGKQESKLFFNYIFGNVPLDNNAILGSGYYFTDYNNAIKQICLFLSMDTEINEWKTIPVGIIRYALFLGNNLLKLNYPNDMNDESELKYHKLQTENNTTCTYEKMTLRISDYDGIWKENYDSVFLGKIELDNGEELKNTPMYVCKDYYSHVPLSYHYVNTLAIHDILNENEMYYEIK